MVVFHVVVGSSRLRQLIFNLSLNMFDDASAWADFKHELTRWLIFDNQLPKMKLQEFPILTPPLPDSETVSMLF